MDTLTPAERSERMSRVRGKDTVPELAVRRLVFAMGYRYRLHAKDLPGKPDLVFRSRKSAVFVHGCFWHRHRNCSLARFPKSRLDFWKAKLESNAERDQRNLVMLRERGWRTLVVWECEMKDMEQLATRLRRFLEGNEE